MQTQIMKKKHEKDYIQHFIRHLSFEIKLTYIHSNTSMDLSKL